MSRVSAETAWTLIGVLGVLTVALKSIGPLVAGGRELPPRMAAVIALLPAALLAALVITSTLTDEEGEIAVGADAVGVLTAAAVVWRSGSVLGGVFAALLVTAGLRAIA